MPFDFIPARSHAARILEGWSPLAVSSRRSGGHRGSWLGFFRSLLSI